MIGKEAYFSLHIIFYPWISNFAEMSQAEETETTENEFVRGCKWCDSYFL